MILSAGVIPVHLSRDGVRFLLLRVFRYWDFPKGELAPGEEPLAAACREVREETGLGDLEFRWGTAFYETPPYGRRAKVARYYLAHTPATDVHLGINPELERPEHHGFRWVGSERARVLLNPRVTAALDWALGRMGEV